jgi:hypothetical protein
MEMVFVSWPARCFKPRSWRAVPWPVQLRPTREAEALAAFPDRSSLEPLLRYLRDSGLDDATARNRAAAMDAFVLGVSTRRVLRSRLGDPAELQAWLGTTIQRLADT